MITKVKELKRILTQAGFNGVSNFTIEVFDSDGYIYDLVDVNFHPESKKVIISIKDVILTKEDKYPPLSNE